MSGLIILDKYSPDPLLARFEYKKLPSRLAVVALPFFSLAYDIDQMLPNNEDKHDALRKLLVARNATVRAVFNLVDSDSMQPSKKEEL